MVSPTLESLPALTLHRILLAREQQQLVGLDCKLTTSSTKNT
jgi:hypothetical protein